MSLRHDIVLQDEYIICNVFVLKCVSITNISIKHYMQGVIR